MGRRPEPGSHDAQPGLLLEAIAQARDAGGAGALGDGDGGVLAPPGVDPKSIPTEVILLPAAFFMEKEGTITNSGGMVQWRNAA